MRRDHTNFMVQDEATRRTSCTGHDLDGEREALRLENENENAKLRTAWFQGDGRRTTDLR